MDYGTIIAALVAALVAVGGYLIAQNSARRERKTKFFAEALLAVKDFEELPYRIARRSDDSPETRERLGRLITDAYVKLAFYQAWLQIDSPFVARAYLLLSLRAERFGEIQRQHAWSSPLITNNKEADLGSRYYYGTKRASAPSVARHLRSCPGPAGRISVRVTVIDPSRQAVRSRRRTRKRAPDLGSAGNR